MFVPSPGCPWDRHAVWEIWRTAVQPTFRIVGDLIVKALVWSIWLARNDCIFNASITSAYVIMLKIDHTLLSWFSSAADGIRVKLE